MKNLSAIQTLYPESIKAKPKGWKFITGNTIVREGDMVWDRGAGSYEELKERHIIGDKAIKHVPIIRQIQSAKKDQNNSKTLQQENAALKEELRVLKAKIAVFIEGVK